MLLLLWFADIIRFPRSQVKTIGAVLRKELDIPIIEVDEPDAYIDGADMLFTGKKMY